MLWHHLGVQDHDEGIAAKVALDLGASLERLSLASSKSTESSKVMYAYLQLSHVPHTQLLAAIKTRLQPHDYPLSLQL